MGKEFHSFFKTVGGNEGSRCHYSTRLDLYGCGCSHDCSYCYAKSLLSFRGLWNPSDPATANAMRVDRAIKRHAANGGGILRLGGMTDCFQGMEMERKATYRAIQSCNKYGVGYLIVTKSDLVAIAFTELCQPVIPGASIEAADKVNKFSFFRQTRAVDAPLPCPSQPQSPFSISSQ